MKSTTARWIPLVLLPLASCILVVDGSGSSDDGFTFWSGTKRGSGVRGDETRTPEAFHAIDLETCADVTVRIGDTPSIHLTGDQELLSKVQTDVRQGVLRIDMLRGYSFRCGLTVEVTTPALDRFDIEGSGDVKIQGVQGDEIHLEIEGSGAITAQGTVRSLSASIEGSGDLKLSELRAETADVSIDGSGTIAVDVAGSLRYSIEGSGTVRYDGDPELHGKIEGSGDIVRTHP